MTLFFPPFSVSSSSSKVAFFHFFLHPATSKTILKQLLLSLKVKKHVANGYVSKWSTPNLFGHASVQIWTHFSGPKTRCWPTSVIFQHALKTPRINIHVYMSEPKNHLFWKRQIIWTKPPWHCVPTVNFQWFWRFWLPPLAIKRPFQVETAGWRWDA